MSDEYDGGSEPAGTEHASQLRRAVGLLIDWIASLLVGTLLVDGKLQLWPLLIFGVINIVLITTIGQTLGMRIAGTVIVPWGPGTPWPMRVAVRTALLLLVVPAAIGGAGGRPLHDRIAGTAIIRRAVG